MINILIFDFSRTLLFPKDKRYSGTLNGLYKKVAQEKGFKFSNYFEFNEYLLKYLNKIKNQYYLGIFTTGTIQEAPEVRQRVSKIFKKVYSVERLRLDKQNKKSYEFIAKDLRTKPSGILYIDDSINNLKIA